jgi:hypothetical protein
MKIHIIIAIPGRASSLPWKQRNKQPVAFFDVPVKGRWMTIVPPFPILQIIINSVDARPSVDAGLERAAVLIALFGQAWAGFSVEIAVPLYLFVYIFSLLLKPCMSHRPNS